MPENRLRTPPMNLLLVAIIFSFLIFGGLGSVIASYGGYYNVALACGLVGFIGSLTTLIIFLIFGSWKQRHR